MSNSQFKIPFAARTLTHPITPQFKIQNSKFSPSPTIAGTARTPSLLNPPTSPILPTRLTCPTCLTRPSSPTIHNSKFTIPLALFRAYYRLEKRLSLWWVKEIAGLFFCIVLISKLLEY